MTSGRVHSQPQSPFGGRSLNRRGVPHLLDVRGNLPDEESSAKRFHDDHAETFGRRVFQAFKPGLRVHVHVIELDLADRPVESVDNLLERLLVAVEGEPGIQDAAAAAFPFEELEDAQFDQPGPVVLVQTVEQVVVDAIGLQFIELHGENRLHVLRSVHIPRGELRRQANFVAARVFRDELTEKRFAVAVVIGKGCIEIIDPLFHRGF